MNWVIIGSCNGLLPVQCQAISLTKADSHFISLSGTHYNGTLFAFKYLHLKVSWTCRQRNAGLILHSSMCQVVWVIRSDTVTKTKANTIITFRNNDTYLQKSAATYSCNQSKFVWPVRYNITLIFEVWSLYMGAILLSYDKLSKHVISPVNTLHLQISVVSWKQWLAEFWKKMTIGH